MAQNQKTPLQERSAAVKTEKKSLYNVARHNGKLILSDGRSETVVSNDPNASSPVTGGNDVFYIMKTKGDQHASGSSIYAYNIHTKQTENIIQANAAESEYNLNNVVENILLDKKNNKLYFSTSLKNRRGYAQFLTWSYDISSKKLAVYKDGRIDSIDEDGNHVIVFKGFDSKGQYTSKLLCGIDGNIIKELDREYASKQLGNTK